MKNAKIELYPTKVMHIDCSNTISRYYADEMVQDIDEMERSGDQILTSDRSPKLQCAPVLFHSRSTPAWKCLHNTFLMACKEYETTVRTITSAQDMIEPLGASAWFVKQNNTINENNINPYHDHSPAYLSGIFYLRVPEGEGGGTEFIDPRTNQHKNISRRFLAPKHLNWLIFPSWLSHRTEWLDSDDSRYVIAANVYTRPLRMSSSTDLEYIDQRTADYLR